MRLFVKVLAFFLLAGGVGDVRAQALWRLSRAGDQLGLRHTLTSDGQMVIAGFEGSTGAEDIWVVKAMPSGSVSWQRTFGGPYTDQAFAVEATAGGGVVVAGMSRSFLPANDLAFGDALVFTLTAAGTVGWAKGYSDPLLLSGDNRFEFAFDVKPTADGGFVFAGQTSFPVAELGAR